MRNHRGSSWSAQADHPRVSLGRTKTRGSSPFGEDDEKQQLWIPAYAGMTKKMARTSPGMTRKSEGLARA
jgi:hypothetical protein